MTDSAQAVRKHDPRRLAELMVKFDLHFATAEECDAVHALAVETISPHVASTLALRRVHEVTGAAIFVNRRAGEIVGVVAVVPLKAAGVVAVQQHLFDSRNPPNEFLCEPGAHLAGLYGWGFSARTRKVSAQVVAASKALRDHLWDVPFFSRAATPAGARVLRGRLGYRPYLEAPDDLLWNPTQAIQERVA